MRIYDKPPAEEYGAAKLKILELLWDGDWVLGDTILDVTQQSYYDRRIRELRDEDGWDIETGWLENEEGKKRPAYHLRSHQRAGGIKRPSISAQERKLILTRSNFVCQICGIDLHDGVNNPQIDHKVPLLRNGLSHTDNYQAICANCNVVKRGICKKCTLASCDNCYLAYPEKGANNLLINLSEVENTSLSSLAQQLHKTRVETLKWLIEHFQRP